MSLPLFYKIRAVEIARKNFIRAASGLNSLQAEFKPSPKVWSVRDIVEHMVWAERAGVVGMWKATQNLKNGLSGWEGENINAGLSIEEVVNRTWQPKEQVPKIAEPKWGGPLEFWLASLAACEHPLNELGEALRGMDPESIIYPHPISGPLHVNQRLEFLRFHLERHQGQIERLKGHEKFPR